MTQSKPEEALPGVQRRLLQLTSGRLRVLVAVLLLLAAASGIMGCVVVDRYSDRAVQYNKEAEEVQDQDLLLNVLRARMRRPLQFSGVQTVSGNGTASGGLTFTWPLRKGGVKTPTTLATTTTFSGGPTFAVGILDTQDFYQGILTQLPLNIVDLYYQERYSSTMLFNIFVAQIVIKQTDKKTEQTNILEIPNNVGRDQDFDRFQTIIDYLLNLGLSTESKSKPTAFGTVLTPYEAADLEDLSRAATAGLDVRQVKWCDLAESDWREVLARLPNMKPGQQQDALKKLHEICDPPNALADLADKLKLSKVAPNSGITCDSSESDWRESLRTHPPGVGETSDDVVKKIHNICDYQDADVQATKLSEQLPNVPSALYRTQKSDKSFQLCFRPLPSGPPPDALRLAIANSIANSAAACGGKRKALPQNTPYAKSLPGVNTLAAPMSQENAPGELGFKALTLGPEIAERLKAIDSTDWQGKEGDALLRGDPTADFPWKSASDYADCQKVCPPNSGSLSKECIKSDCSKYGAYGNKIDFAKEVQIEFAPRSTEGIIYYLGEIVRREIGPQDRQNNQRTHARTIAIKYNSELYRTIPDDICLTAPSDLGNGFRCEPMFVLNKATLPVLETYWPILGVTYDGDGYVVPSDSNVAGRTPQVMDMTLQLIGLFKSAKSLPTTSVFTLIGTP